MRRQRTSSIVIPLRDYANGNLNNTTNPPHRTQSNGVVNLHKASGPSGDFGVEIGGKPPQLEVYLTIREIAEKLLGNRRLYFTVRRWFENEDGVLDAGNGKHNRYRLIPLWFALEVIEKRTRRRTYAKNPSVKLHGGSDHA